MGQSLFLGIATNIKIEKSKYSKEEILSEVDKVFPKNLFNIIDHEDFVEFNIKNELLEEHLQNFLKEQFVLLNIQEDEREKQLIDGLQSMKADEIIQCGKEQSLPPAFTFTSDSRLGYCRYLFRKWDRQITFQIDCWSYYHMFGTYIDDGIDEFFNMMRTLIEKTSENPLAKLFYMDLQ